jgi:hypothetical protein
MSTNAPNVPRTVVLSFTVCIGLGLFLVITNSMGISNAKKRSGGKYGIQVIGLIFSIFWTLFFSYKLVKASGAAAGALAQLTRMRGGGSTNATLSGAPA